MNGTAGREATILVTGAVGFVGRHLLARLRADMPSARLVAGNRGDAPADFPFETSVFDITDRAACAGAVAAVRPDAVVHLAAVAAPAEARGNPRRAWDINVFGPMNMADAVLAHAPDARFIFVSSSEAYGDSLNVGAGATDETALLAPNSPYGATKAAADLLIGQMARDGLRAVRFRPFNHTGPGQAGDYVIPSFARQIARIEAGLQEPVISVGNLDAARDFLDVRDVVRAYAAAIRADAPAGVALNLASGQPWRIGEALAFMLARAKVSIEVKVDPAKLRPIDVPRTCGDAALAGRLLGWKPAVSFETTLADVLDDWRARVAAGA